MSTRDDYHQLNEAIELMAEEQVILPNMPVDVFIQEAEDLYRVALADKEKLMQRGLPEESIEDLNLAAGACRYAQAEWNNERNAKKEAEQEWKERSPGAYELRDDLIDEFNFAFTDDKSLLSILDRIKEGNGHADMIQDLIDLAVLGKENKEVLSATNFDVSMLDHAESVADEMADLLGMANGGKNENNQAKLLRDKAYTYLKRYVDEVRRYGKFVFRKDEDHAAKYASDYRRN